MSKTYGIARVSTKTQNIGRQVRNIKAIFPDAIISKEYYTGTKIDRPELTKVLRAVKSGDTLVFDSVSRMSRDSEEGFALYEELFNKGVELVFIKEPYINTETYRKALSGSVAMTGTNADFILEGVNKYLLALAKEQIKVAFQQAQKEVDDNHQRTREGIETARLAGKQIGQKKGAKLVVKKKAPALEKIKMYSKDFDGTLSDDDVMKLVGVSRNTYYRYKKELREAM